MPRGSGTRALGHRDQVRRGPRVETREAAEHELEQASRDPIGEVPEVGRTDEPRDEPVAREQRAQRGRVDALEVLYPVEDAAALGAGDLARREVLLVRRRDPQTAPTPQPPPHL